MMIQALSRPCSSFGRCARARLFSALIAASACAALACSDDDPAPQTGLGGSSGVELDASVRDLPGDGTEPTPESDIEMRQRTPVGPDGLNEAIDEVRNPNSEPDADAPDAAPDAALDAGAS